MGIVLGETAARDTVKALPSCQLSKLGSSVPYRGRHGNSRYCWGPCGQYQDRALSHNLIAVWFVLAVLC